MKERNQEIHVLWTREEMDRLKEKMEEAGVKNRSAYVRKMALDGYVVRLDMTDINELIRILAGIHVEELTVAEPDLEEIVLHYYGKDGDQA